MAEKITIGEMRKLIQRLEEAKGLYEEIPQSYINRLERSAQLLAELKKIPGINWDDLTTADDIERAEGMIHQKLELKNEIEKHLATCALTVSGRPGRRGRRPSIAPLPPGRQRQPRRSREQVEFDLKIAEIQREKKGELGLPPRGRLTSDDKAKLEKEVEREIKRQKLATPKG